MDDFSSCFKHKINFRSFIQDTTYRKLRANKFGSFTHIFKPDAAVLPTCIKTYPIIAGNDL